MTCEARSGSRGLTLGVTEEISEVDYSEEEKLNKLYMVRPDWKPLPSPNRAGIAVIDGLRKMCYYGRRKFLASLLSILKIAIRRVSVVM